MKYRLLFLSVNLLFAPTVVFGACSVANLTRCLDSVCAINIGANPAARCQYCGTDSAGEPSKSGIMKSISAGASSKYIVSDKELKSAPTSAGERYAWGTRLCLEKIPDCTTDDVDNNYDRLIEQSCRAAGISAEMTNLTKKIKTVKNQTTCASEIESCMVDEKHCSANYKNCKSDSDFNNYFSQCSVASNGCESYLSNIKNTLASFRANSFANADKLLKNIVSAYQSNRNQRLTTAQSGCKNNKATNDCITRVCQNNMRNKCANENEKSAARELCKFYDTACERLK